MFSLHCINHNIDPKVQSKARLTGSQEGWAILKILTKSFTLITLPVKPFESKWMLLLQG